MKTPMPEPEGEIYDARCGYIPTSLFTESQLRAAMRDAFNEGLEEAAKAAKSLDNRENSTDYCNAASMAQIKILALKEQTP